MKHPWTAPPSAHHWLSTPIFSSQAPMSQSSFSFFSVFALQVSSPSSLFFSQNVLLLCFSLNLSENEAPMDHPSLGSSQAFYSHLFLSNSHVSVQFFFLFCFCSPGLLTQLSIFLSKRPFALFFSQSPPCSVFSFSYKLPPAPLLTAHHHHGKVVASFATRLNMLLAWKSSPHSNNMLPVLPG